MHLDINTLYYAMWTLATIAAVGLILGLDATGRSALRMWLFALLLNAVGGFVLIVTTHDQPQLLLSLEGALTSIGVTAVYFTTSRFLHRPSPSSLWWGLAIITGGLIWLYRDNLPVATAFGSAFAGCQIGVVCFQLAQAGRAAGRWRVTALIALTITLPFTLGRVLLPTPVLAAIHPDVLEQWVNQAGFLVDFASVVLLHMAFLLAYGQEAQGKLATLANQDGLSGLLNRRAWMASAGKVLIHHVGPHMPTVVLLDVDHFKAVNDTHGHSTGDQVIQCLADSLRQGLRGTDIVGRYGGEEFCILFPRLNPGELEQVDARLRQHLMTSVMGRLNLPVTFSAGAATLRAGETLEAALHRADTALYGAKRGGRDRLMVQEQMAQDTDAA